MVVVSYFHQAIYNLKKIGKRVGVDIVFSTPLKFSGLCVKVKNTTKKCHGCNKKQNRLYHEWKEGYTVFLCHVEKNILHGQAQASLSNWNWGQ